jgi:mannose-6-phosphate isomerase-like protein (cupin superfamily)
VIPIISLKEKLSEIAERPWHPIELARVNDQVVRMALCIGEYHWHKHTNEDELFYILKGELTIQMNVPYSNITLHEGELTVVPKGVEHCPKSSQYTYVLMFEPHILKSQGD